MQSMKKSGALTREDSMETQGTGCSSPYCSLYRFRRSQSVSEINEDILNISPRISHCNANIRVDRRLHYQNSLSIPVKASWSSCSKDMASTEVPLRKSAADIVKEISTLELEVVHLERYLLSLYQTAFDQYQASSPTRTTRSSRSPVACHTRSTVQDSTRIPIEHQTSHSTNSYNMSDQMDRSQSRERTEKRDINCSHIEDSLTHDMTPNLDTNFGPSPREGSKYDDIKSMPSHRSLAEHLGASIADHVPETPSRLSEDIVRCICAIYCKLSTSPTQQMDLLASPTPSASTSSTFSPRDACDSWSPRCHHEAVTSPSSFDSPKNKQAPYIGMTEIPKISIDGDKFGYASKMLNIFRITPARRLGQDVGSMGCISWSIFSLPFIFHHSCEFLCYFRSLIRRLEKIRPGRMDHEEKLAFWINIHNALVMHAFLAYGLHQNQMKSTLSILKAAYDIGGYSVNAYVIQSSILGCQLHRPALGIRALLSPSTKLKKGKDKHPYALKHPEPLAHFALCLGAHSDPAVRAYTAKNIYQELKLAKEEFIQANVWVQKESKIIMPKILSYYARDASLELSAIVEMVSNGVPEDQRTSIRRCLLRRKLDKCVEWSPYKSSFRYFVHRDLAKN